MLRKWPVSKRINSSRAPKEDATLIDEVPLELGGLAQFLANGGG